MSLLRVAERLLKIEQRPSFASRGASSPQRQILEPELRALQPRRIGLLARELGLDLLVLDDAAFLEVDQQHLAGLQPPLADDFSSGTGSTPASEAMITGRRR